MGAVPVIKYYQLGNVKNSTHQTDIYCRPMSIIFFQQGGIAPSNRLLTQ